MFKTTRIKGSRTRISYVVSGFSRTVLSGFSRTVILGGVLAVLFSPAAYTQTSRTIRDGVYTSAQAMRGQALYKQQCASCHGETLGGAQAPPLTADDFVRTWHMQPLSELVSKIKNTMPANMPGQLTRQQSADLVAYILQVGKFPGGGAELTENEQALKQITWPAGIVADRPASASQGPTFPPMGNMAQVMRGVFFPNSNLIFNVQTHDPGEVKKGAPPAPAAGGFSWVDWGAGIYPGWELVDNAAIALAEASPMMLVPGRRCENGKPVPVTDAEWVKFTREMVDAAKTAYKASQSRNREAVAEATGLIADACLNCHQVYRDKRGRNAAGGLRDPIDPSNKALRCVK